MDWIATLRLELATAVAFLTRLPVRLETPLALAAASRAFPLAGTLVGGIAAAVLALAHLAGIPPLVAALLAVGASIIVTGALHEDGLADSADGLFSGRSRERILEIFRDSRIGTFGALALILSIGLRTTALATLIDGAAALIAVHALARGWLPWLMRNDMPARADGLAAEAGQPAAEGTLWAAGLGFAVAVVALGPGPAILAAAVSAACALGVAALARRRLGGYTGDTLGAAEQMAEIGALLALSTLS